VIAPSDFDGLSNDLKQLIVKLLAETAELKRENAELREEIVRLKGLKRPQIKPRRMEKRHRAEF